MKRAARVLMVPRALLVPVWCALVALAASQLPRLSFDNDTWLAPDHPQRVQLENFRAEFEPDEALLVVLELTRDFFEPRQTQAVERLDAALNQLPQTKSVLSPLSATTIIDTGDTLEISSFGDALRRGFLADADAYRARFLDSPYAGKLLSDDRRKVLLYVAIARADVARRAEAVAAVAGTVRRHGFGAVDSDGANGANGADAENFGALHFAGEAALKDELNRVTREQLPLLLLLAAAVLAVFLRAACGGWRRAGLIFTAAAAAVAACLGMMAAFGWPMSVVLLMLPVMIAVIAVADGLHILACWDALAELPQSPQSSSSPFQQGTRIGETIRQSWAPCLGATVTSAVGFGAFAISELAPLRHFGGASAFSILYAYPLVTGALWGGLWMFPSLAHAPARRFGWARLVRIAERLSGAFPRRVTTIAICAAALLGGGLGLLRTETNFLSVFFAEDSAMRKSFDLVDAELGGSGRVEVVLRRGEDAFATVAGMREAESLARRFTGIATVNTVDSYLLPVGMADRAFGGAGLPRSDEALAQELLFLSLSRNETERDVLSPYLDFTHGAVRLSLQTPNLNSPALKATIAAVTDIATPPPSPSPRTHEPAADATADDATASTDPPKTKPTAADLTITGFGVFIHNLGEQVLRTQIFSILLTLLVIGALLLLQFGLRAGLCGFVANLLPLAATAGLVAWLGYPYDFAVILIAGVTLGLSVDDTIHFLHHYRRRRGNAASARRRALERTARPIVITTALFCCGLGIVAFSELVVLRRFAAFTMFGVSAALASVLLFLPAALAMISRANDPAQPASNRQAGVK